MPGESVRVLERWRKEWEKSPRYRKMTRVDASLPSDRYFKIVKSLPKAVTALMTQLRTGHAPLNKHLHAISAAESLHCQHCEGVPENVQHFLLTCLHYRSQRHQLRRGLGHRANDLSYLLTSAKAIPHVVDFVNATHQEKVFPTELCRRLCSIGRLYTARHQTSGNRSQCRLW